ncbi:InlB B-repeat-containing protein [Ereboglobus luteus]|uniref:Bacterial repeat domain-containing protein n=1 Tax=Ereboglobus luteus TaxID=1796921 RepID=A0A2U8E0U9_9BACT|nr:hypothetical protein [Ereboglobus luteus]AWI08468.1 hypothetical protein CKA38_03675 [Ereboglobus luteus]
MMPALAQAQQHTLTISVQNSQYAVGGSISPGSGSHSYTNGESVTLSAEARPGYTYRWECAAAPAINNQTGSVSLTMNQNYAVTLVFEPAYYSLTLDSPMPGGTVSVVSPASVNLSSIAASTLVTVKATPATGYHFVRWEPDPVGTVLSPSFTSLQASVYMNRNVRLTPVFAQSTYLLEVLDSPESIGGETTGGGYYVPGATATVTATPNAGFLFDGWTVTLGSVTISDPASASTTVALGSGAGPWKITANFRVADPLAATLHVGSGSGGKVVATPSPLPM